MSEETWLEKTLAERPPLTREQIARLRPILAPATPHMRTPPAVDEGRTQTPANTKGITSP